MRKNGVKPIDPYTLIRIEQAKRELQAIQKHEEPQELMQTAVVVSAMEEAHEKLQEELAAEAYESLAKTMMEAAAPAAAESEQTIEQKPFNNITGMKIFIESEDQQTTLFVGVNTEGEKDTLRLAISNKEEQGDSSSFIGANLSYEMLTELIEALNIQKSKMKR